MGGLLAAEAATHISNNPNGYRPHRIVAMIAFDTPYLGMHPHVVITGIASLFADDGKDKKTESEMNEHPTFKSLIAKLLTDGRISARTYLVCR